jgi:hypothetical protein
MAKWLFGEGAARTTEAVAQAVQTATGTHDPAAQRSMIEQQPDVAETLRIELARLAAAAEADARKVELATFTAQVADVAGARAQTVALAQASPPAAYGAPVVSAIVLATFAVVMALALLHTMPAGSETILNMLLGSLAAMATSVVSYWVGSSAGSARKDEHIAQLAAGGR